MRGRATFAAVSSYVAVRIPIDHGIPKYTKIYQNAWHRVCWCRVFTFRRDDARVGGARADAGDGDGDGARCGAVRARRGAPGAAVAFRVRAIGCAREDAGRRWRDARRWRANAANAT